MSMETDYARLDERLSNLIARFDKMEITLNTLALVHQQNVGARWMLRFLGGSTVAGMGAGAIKVIEWLSQNTPSPPYHP